MTRLLQIENLHVSLPVDAGTLHAVRGIHLQVDAGKTLGIVGESGCGKSLTSLALMGLLPGRARVQADLATFGGEDLLRMPERRRNELRGSAMAMIFQDPMTSLNPSYTIGNQLCEVFVRHGLGNRAQATERAAYLLSRAGIPNPGERLRQYPHQLSGGLRQRVMIAMALMCGPRLIIADEPTTALDVTVQAQILELLKSLQSEFGMALILVTHDLGVVSSVADSIAVMYAGQIVETGSAARVLAAPSHPYTQGLLACLPSIDRIGRGRRLGTIRGIVPSLIGDTDGCAFASRCQWATERCATGTPPWQGEPGGDAFRCSFSTAERRARTLTEAAP